MVKKRYNHQTLVVDSLDEIPSYEIGSLSIGDVVECDGDLYIISHKTENEEINLTCASEEAITTAIYLFDTETKAWEFDEITVTPIVDGGLELIEWDGERKFTADEIEKLSQMKAYVYDGETIYIACSFLKNTTLGLVSVDAYDDIDLEGNDIVSLTINGIIIDISNNDFGSAKFVQLFKSDLQGTKLYRHEVSIVGTITSIEFIMISLYPNEITLSYLENPGIFLGRDYIACSADLLNDLWLTQPMNFYVSGANDLLIIIGADTVTLSGVTQITDTVTEL